MPEQTIVARPPAIVARFEISLAGAPVSLWRLPRAIIRKLHCAWEYICARDGFDVVERSLEQEAVVAKCDLPKCSWHPIKHHFRSKKMVEVRGLVLHITDSKDTLESLRNGFDDPKQPPPQRSSHFAISKTGEIWQFVDTDDVAFAVDGIWGGDGIDNHWVSVENIAKYPEALTDAQVGAAGDLLFWLNKQHSVPFVLAEKKDDRGLGYHRMFKRGDHICPGDNVIKQRPEILSMAKWGF